MVTIAYGGGRVLLTQWRTALTCTRASRSFPCQRHRGGRPRSETCRPSGSEGSARGTFTLIGADGAVHRESFDVAAGVLLWKEDEMTFLLQGAGSSLEATSLAAEVGR